MKIIAIGDIEGKMPKNLLSNIKKEKPDLIIYTGDFPDRSAGRKIEWSLWDMKLDRKTFRKEFLRRSSKIIDKEMESGKSVMRKLAGMRIPILFLFGNHDMDERNKKYPLLEYSKKFKNMVYLHKKCIRIDNFIFVGHGGYRGFASKQDMFRKVTGAEKKKIEMLKARYRRELGKIFSNKKNVIFITHDVPYGTKFDKINNPDSPINGKHIGDDVYREFILRKRPMLHICGHMHEYQGKTKLGKTPVILPGFGQKGKYAVITLPGRKVVFTTIKV